MTGKDLTHNRQLLAGAVALLLATVPARSDDAAAIARGAAAAEMGAEIGAAAIAPYMPGGDFGGTYSPVPVPPLPAAPAGPIIGGATSAIIGGSSSPARPFSPDAQTMCYPAQRTCYDASGNIAAGWSWRAFGSGR